MKKASIIMAVLACAIIAAAYTNSVPISTNTRAATEKWTAIRFEPALPPTPENAEANFLNGNREWQTVAADQIGAATTQQLAATTAALSAHIVRTDNPHGVTAASLGAITAEQDLAALRTYHYGSPDIVESPAEWFNFDGAGTITAFNREVGGEKVVIPWEIGGVPVTTIGADAFLSAGIVVSVIAPQTVTVIGNDAFNSCNSLTSVTLPQAQTIGGFAFYGCGSLASVRMGQNAPAEATSVFAGITPPPTVYVTNPTATGWGAEWNGAPVVRPALYGSNVTAQAFTLNGDTITEWPSGGGETSIIKPVVTSSTNVVVTSTQSVYSVALTVASNVGVDFSNLALGGVSNAAVTLYLDCQTTQALYSVFDTNAIAMDCAWEPTVTGRYELVVSSDGVRTTAFQMSPSMCFFAPALISFDVSQTSFGAVSTTLFPSGTLSGAFLIANENNPRELAFLRLALSFGYPEVDGHLSFVCGSVIIGAFDEWSSVTNAVLAYPSGVNGYKRAYVPMRPAAAVSGFALPMRMVRVIKDVDDSRSTTITSATIRRMNALERAAYNAGAYPSAFRLDY